MSEGTGFRVQGSGLRVQARRRAIDEAAIFALLEALAGGAGPAEAAASARCSRHAVRILRENPQRYRPRVANVARFDELRRQWLARDGDAGEERGSGPAVRCPGCGHKVALPCILCRTREATADGLLPTPGICDRRGRGDPTPEQIQARKPPQRLEPMWPVKEPTVREYFSSDLIAS